MRIPNAKIFPSSEGRASGESRAPHPLSPAEQWVAAQSTLLILVSSWGCGGRASWASTVMLGLATLGWVAILPRFRDGERLPRHVFIPLALWVVLGGCSMLNPSHTLKTEGWIPQPGWIPWLPGTVDRDFTLAAQLPWLAALLQSTLLAAVRPGARAVRFIWTVVAVNGFCLAATGAMFHFAHAPLMLGFIHPPESTYFFATFFYKNHWAAYGAIASITSGALALRSWHGTLAGDPKARERFLLFSFMCVLTAITLPLPGSRSGALFATLIVIAFLAGLLTQLWREARFSFRRRITLTICVIVSLVGLASYGANAYAPKALQDWNRTTVEVSEWKQGAPLGLRARLSADTARMAKSRPVFGWGVGSFQIVFPAFQGDYLRDANGQPEARFEFAHNDWLQLIAETGIAGLLALVVPLSAVLCRSWRSTGFAGRWALAGCVGVLFYAWIDFPFSNPAVCTLWVILVLTAGRFAPLRISKPEHAFPKRA